MPLELSSQRSVPADVAASYRARGFWTDQSLGEVVAAGLGSAAGQPFTVRSSVRPWSGTFADVDRAARSLAGFLRSRGVGAGDVVAFQLPNWAEAGAVFWAAAYLGAVVVPIVHFYGPAEVGYILDGTQPAAIVTPDEFGRMDYLANYDDLLAHRAGPLWLVVRSTTRPLPPRATEFASLLDGDAVRTPARADPASPAVIGFTSGTTRNPKGVVHSHQTIAFEARQLDMVASRWPVITGTPVGHFMGMLSAFLLPLVRPKPVHMIDIWNPGEVLRTMLAEGLGVGGGATFFLTSLLDHPDFTAEHAALIPAMGLGGAPVPVAVTERAKALGINVYRSYGSTEHPSVTGSLPTDPEEKRLRTDGHALPGVEVRLGDEGQILTRGPDRFLGYTEPELTAAAIDADGWYRTGDVGVIDDDGYLTITDRMSDIIIRGGENISAAEIEDVLTRLPGAAEVSVVSAPDSRLGERAAAVLRLHRGEPVPTLTQVREHLAALGVSRQKWPESLYVVEDFPRTASGKIQKFRIRDEVWSGVLKPVES